ncbi:hypothetical protein MKZ07_20690 [Paenibacillus sp. FSL P4-0338]|uniref:hypothetical protein n=1 Tax=Paenibacillus sp. FSL P4-0338 TaxID=2921635 RepID=UPI0030F55B0E
MSPRCGTTASGSSSAASRGAASQAAGASRRSGCAPRRARATLRGRFRMRRRLINSFISMAPSVSTGDSYRYEFAAPARTGF